jgi:hypothetical protein
MNTALSAGLVVLVSASLIFSGLVVLFCTAKTAWSFLQLVGAGCLVVVGLCHVCEALYFLPWMQWRLKKTGKRTNTRWRFYFMHYNFFAESINRSGATPAMEACA